MLTSPGQPFLRWAGGKRWLAPQAAELFGPHEGRYIEPFLGSGAVFFALAPEKAILADSNGDLIDCYRCVRDEPDSVVTKLLGMDTSRDAYYRYRAQMPKRPTDRAARFIYLNRTSFNGLYRVNREGVYNVPYGYRGVGLGWLRPIIEAASIVLQNTELMVADFRKTLEEAARGDLCYCDPPYVVGHANNGFLKYNEKLFAWEDQRDLASAARNAVRAGATVWISAAGHDCMLELYRGFTATKLVRRTSLSGAVAGRGEVSEYLIMGGSRD